MATVEDLYRVEGQAELIRGEVVKLPPHGLFPARIIGNLLAGLHAVARVRGHAFASTLGYVIPALPNGRESFCPDASYYDGPLPSNRMHFIEGPPAFAVEVRGEGDVGPAADAAFAAKRADYFAAGTLVVWDIDPMAETVTVYRAETPGCAAVRRAGDTADAEPAVPGWSITLAEVFA